MWFQGSFTDNRQSDSLSRICSDVLPYILAMFITWNDSEIELTSLLNLSPLPLVDTFKIKDNFGILENKRVLIRSWSHSISNFLFIIVTF